MLTILIKNIGNLSRKFYMYRVISIIIIRKTKKCLTKIPLELKKTELL